jgi:hypothetical protein
LLFLGETKGMLSSSTNISNNNEISQKGAKMSILFG